MAVSREGDQALLIVLQELLFGAERHARPAVQRQNVRLVPTQVNVTPFDARDMTVAAKLRARLGGRGRPFGPYDSLIAGQALARGWTVVTANYGEFSRVEGLSVTDWTALDDQRPGADLR